MFPRLQQRFQILSPSPGNRHLMNHLELTRAILQPHSCKAFLESYRGKSQDDKNETSVLFDPSHLTHIILKYYFPPHIFFHTLFNLFPRRKFILQLSVSPLFLAQYLSQDRRTLRHIFQERDRSSHKTCKGLQPSITNTAALTFYTTQKRRLQRTIHKTHPFLLSTANHEQDLQSATVGSSCRLALDGGR